MMPQKKYRPCRWNPKPRLLIDGLLDVEDHAFCNQAEEREQREQMEAKLTRKRENKVRGRIFNSHMEWLSSHQRLLILEKIIWQTNGRQVTEEIAQARHFPKSPFNECGKTGQKRVLDSIRQRAPRLQCRILSPVRRSS